MVVTLSTPLLHLTMVKGWSGITHDDAFSNAPEPKTHTHCLISMLEDFLKMRDNNIQDAFSNSELSLNA
jgi:hypothetical protein